MSDTEPVSPLAPRSIVWALWGCNLLMFFKSVCVMVMELTASRLIAKSVGSSLYTWTSVIGVVLAGISLGNFLGGWLADRYPHRKLLTWQFLIASVCMLTIYPLNQLISAGGRAEWVSWPVWIVIVVAAIFFHPSVALGTISPVVASLALSYSKEGRGKTVGNVFAWETMGSIAGTFLAGFFLISQFGTQNIIWMVSGLLCVMGLLVGTGQRFLRGAMLFGWLQFVVWIGFFASATQPISVAASSTESENDSVWFQDLMAWSGEVKGQAHELGRKLNLRQDEPHEYTTESDYFYINVTNVHEQGDTVKALHLDHLTHSYYNPLKPTKLYYEYELVYAGVTERATENWQRATSVPLPQLPASGKSLPPWAKYDAATKTLSITGGLSVSRRDDLLQLSASAPYWKAVTELTSLENQELLSGLSSVSLEGLPEGLTLPDSLREKVRYDHTLHALLRYDRLSDDERDQLLASGPDAAYLHAVNDLYGRSRQVGTLFLGGGGFVFPRWIETYFPHEPRIDVLELDPAVKQAVQAEMGLPPDDETAVHTILGDARNSVDDLLWANQRREKAGQSPLKYDFAYGDAFNDFSVPWHLTTKEFCQKIRGLLNDEGVYLVNIIDIYPRTEFPKQTPSGFGEVTVTGQLPSEWWSPKNPQKTWIAVPDPKTYGTLEVQQTATDRYQLRYKGVMSNDVWEALLKPLNLAAANSELEESDNLPAGVRTVRDGINQLYDLTHERPSFVGQLPAALLPENLSNLEWVMAKAPFQHLELKQTEVPTGKTLGTDEVACVFGFRGLMTAAELQELIKLGAGNQPYEQAMRQLYQQSQQQQTGQFMGAYIQTLTEVFPNVYIFSTQTSQPSSERDTYVAACSLRPLDLSLLGRSGGHWDTAPFAWTEQTAAGGKPRSGGQMSAIRSLSRGITLTDDFAPVDNMLAPVFADR